jgi:hypothetical protein
MNRMWHAFVVVGTLALAVSASCVDSGLQPIVLGESSNAAPPTEVLSRLLWWSEAQPQPFVIFNPGDTLGSDIPEPLDLVTNVVWLPGSTDSLLPNLFLDSSAVPYFYGLLDHDHLPRQTDAFSRSTSLDSVRWLLRSYPLNFRMMTYDSLSESLGERIYQWASYHQPKQVVWVGNHVLVCREGGMIPANRPFVYKYCRQNLQYLNRSLSESVRRSLIEQTDTSSTIDQLKKVLSPLGQVSTKLSSTGSE